MMILVAFIGLGNMGLPMARNLCRAAAQLGLRVRAYDLQASAMQALQAEGAQLAGSVQAAVDNADVVLSMLPGNLQVEALYLGPDGVLSQLRPGCLLLECSTIGVELARQLAQAAATHGLDWLDAPVSGGTAGAAAGTLSFMVGGEADILERARPLLQAMGQNIFHAGEAGAGQVAKLCNNLLLGILMAGTAEALALGVANGLSPLVLSQIMAQSSGRNWALEQYNPWPGVQAASAASRGYSGGFAVDLMRKDLGLALQLPTPSPTPLGSVAHSLYSQHSEQGHGRLDFSSILQLLHPLDVAGLAAATPQA